MEPNQREGSDTPPETRDAAPAPELIRLQTGVRNLADCCVAPPELSEQFALWFSSSEYPAVNSLWENAGIEAVLERWGAERRCEGGTERAFDSTVVDPDRVCLLQIMKFAEPAQKDETQSQYYRVAKFEIGDSEEAYLLACIHSAGLRESLIPPSDSISGVSLQDKEIVGLGAGVQWYGPDNWYGDGCVFQLSLEVDCGTAENIFVSLSVDEQGNILGKLYSPELFETGYEGHDQRTIALRPDQIDMVAAVITRLRASVEIRMSESTVGAWIGSTIPEPD